MAEIGVVPLAAGGAVKFGTYTGNGAASRTINLGVTPKWVYVCLYSGETVYNALSDGNYYYGGLVGQGYPDTPAGISIVSGGFTVKYSNTTTLRSISNEQGETYYYLYGI